MFVPFPAACDLTTNSGRREWAYYSFLDWANGLTLEEIVALRKVADADYREIHNALRRGDRSALSRCKCHINAIDSAIRKGVVDRWIWAFINDSVNNAFTRRTESSSDASSRSTFSVFYRRSFIMPLLLNPAFERSVWRQGKPRRAICPRP